VDSVRFLLPIIRVVTFLLIDRADNSKKPANNEEEDELYGLYGGEAGNE
jgi:hypothetical protein